MGRHATVTSTFTAEDLAAHAESLTPPHLTILRASLTQSSYAELSAGLGLKEGTVKSRLNRARLALQHVSKRHPNGTPQYAKDGTLLDENGNRSIFDDVDR